MLVNVELIFSSDNLPFLTLLVSVERTIPTRPISRRDYKRQEPNLSPNEWTSLWNCGVAYIARREGGKSLPS
jgi:hypothetical protein